MTDARPRVSIIIVSWNTRDILRDCLASVAAQTTAPHEVIVIDNASRDGSAEMVAAEFPDAVLIANTDNRGFAAANNQGLAVARGDHVLLLNPDTIILDRAIDKMLDWMAGHPDVGGAGCQVLERPGVIQQTCFADHTPVNLAIIQLGLARLSRIVPLFGRFRYDGWDRRSERDVDVVTGMFLLVPRAVLEQIGPLDEAFFVYGEEADWCRRIRNAGWRCVFTPIAQIIHLDGGKKSTTQIRPRMHVQLHKSHLLYIRKHHGRFAHLLTRGVYVVGALGRLSIFGGLRLFDDAEVNRAHVTLARAALRFHLLGKEPAA